MQNCCLKCVGDSFKDGHALSQRYFAKYGYSLDKSPIGKWAIALRDDDMFNVLVYRHSACHRCGVARCNQRFNLVLFLGELGVCHDA